MRYRIYFRHEETKEESAREVEATGSIYRKCDAHGRVIFGEPEPPNEYIIFPPPGREPSYYE